MKFYEEDEKIVQEFSEKYDKKFLNEWKFTPFLKSVLLYEFGYGNSLDEVEKRIDIVDKHTNRVLRVA